MDSANAPKARPNTAPFLFGGLIGFVAGMAVAGVVAVWIYQSSPYRPETSPPTKLESIRKGDAAPSSPAKPASTGVAVTTKDDGKTEAQRITPPSSATATSPAPTSPTPGVAGVAAVPAKPGSNEPSPTAEPRAKLWLQVGAYANPTDAEAQRAKFALLGYEAVVLAADVPEKGVVHRVRVGPFKDPEEMGKARGELARQGIEVSVVKP